MNTYVVIYKKANDTCEYAAIIRNVGLSYDACRIARNTLKNLDRICKWYQVYDE